MQVLCFDQGCVPKDSGPHDLHQCGGPPGSAHYAGGYGNVLVLTDMFTRFIIMVGGMVV